jgi:ABC-type branched-subunit amino acid transport system substrate-binding protein
VLVEGLKRAGANPTRERFVDALEGIKSLDLGGYEISFSDKRHDGWHFVETGVITSTGELRF